MLQSVVMLMITPFAGWLADHWNRYYLTTPGLVSPDCVTSRLCLLSSKIVDGTHHLADCAQWSGHGVVPFAQTMP